MHYVERVQDALARQEDGRYALVDPKFATWLRWRKQPRASRGAFDLLAFKGGLHLGVQVKRSALPLRFGRAEWDRMKSDAKRFGWRFVVASVAQGRVTVLDPAKARRGTEVRLTMASAIDNLLQWIEA